MNITARKPLGTSTINHEFRQKLRLSLGGYVVLDYLFNYCGNKSKYTKLITEVAGFTGDTEDIIESQVQYLIKQEMIIDDFDNLKTSLAFSSLFVHKANLINENFESLWIAYGKVGNKQKAKEMYSRAIKEVKHEYLMQRVQKYIIFINNKGVFQQHLSTWLNPKYKEFDNDYEIEVTQQLEQEESYL